MRAHGGTVVLVGLVLVAASCTADTTETGAQTGPTPTASVPSTTPPPPSSSPAPAGPLVFGAPLPGGCPPDADPRPSQTVAFVAGGRAWALSPRGRLTCLFRTDDPGPFAWGPQGDRVLLGGMRVRFLGGEGTVFLDEPESEVVDFGRPIGKSIVWRSTEVGETHKYTFGSQAVASLADLPDGNYDDLAYHPSGLALGLSLRDEQGTPGIYVATNEGERPERIVVGVSATRFPSVDFTSDGRFLLYLADHKGDFSQLHLIDLADADALEDLWKSEAGVRATGLVLPPDIGDTLAFTLGTTCDDSQAVWGSVNEVTAVMPEETRPTTAVGYLDPRRLLVAIRDCDEATMDLVVAREGEAPLAVATAVEAASARPDGPDGATPLPEDLMGEVREFG